MLLEHKMLLWQFLKLEQFFESQTETVLAPWQIFGTWIDFCTELKNKFELRKSLNQNLILRGKSCLKNYFVTETELAPWRGIYTGKMIVTGIEIFGFLADLDRTFDLNIEIGSRIEFGDGTDLWSGTQLKIWRDYIIS